MMHVWTVVAGHTFETTSGGPLRPSQTTKKVSFTPRLPQSGQHAHPERRALTTGAGPQPQHVLLPGQGDPVSSTLLVNALSSPPGPVRDKPASLASRTSSLAATC